MKFSPSVCVAVVASLTGEMAAQVVLIMLIEQHTVTNPAVIRGLCAITKHQIMLAQARLLMVNHLTSILLGGGSY